MIGKRWLSVMVLGMVVALASVCWATPGDVDGVNGVELKDAVTALQVSAGLTVGDVTLEGDVDGDDAIGVAEAVFALREVAFSTPGRGRAVLGPLAGATVKVYRLGDLETPIYTDTTDADGYFDTQVTGVPWGEYLLVAVSGGEDTDVDDDGVPDAAPTPNAGTIHALMTAADFNQGGFQVTALSDIAWQYTKNLVGDVDASGFKLRLDELAKTFILTDFNGDEKIDAEDILAFLPANQSHQAGLNFDFGDLFAENADGHSIINAYHENLVDILPSLLEDQFWSRLTLAPGADVRYGKIKIEVSASGRGSVTSDIGGIDIDSERNNDSNDVKRAFIEQNADGSVTLTATPIDETEILSWVGCDTVSADKSQCVCNLKTSRLVSVAFGYTETILKEGVTVVDLSDAAVTISTDLATLDLTVDAGDIAMIDKMAVVQVGDIVVGSAGLGFLRRVVSIQADSATHYILSVEDVSLEDIIAQGTMHFSKQLTHEDLVDNGLSGRRNGTSSAAFNGVEGVRLIPPDDPNDKVFRLQVGGRESRATESIEDALTWEDPDTGITAQVKGSIEVTIDIDKDSSWGLFPPGLESARFIPEISATESLEASISGEAKIPDGGLSKHIGTLHFSTFVVQLGAIPIFVTPEVQFTIGLEAEASGQITTGLSFNQTMRAGVTYHRDSGVEMVDSFTYSQEFTPPTAHLEAEIKPYLEAKPVLYLYSVTGPATNLRGYLRFRGEADAQLFSNDPCYGGIRLSAFAGLTADFEWDLGKAKKLGDWVEGIELKKTLFDKEVLLREWNFEGDCTEKPPFMEVSGLSFVSTLSKDSTQILTRDYQIANIGGGVMGWSVSYLEDGVMNVTPMSGSLGEGETATVTVSVDSSMLDVGRYENSIKFLNDISDPAYAGIPTGSTVKWVTIDVTDGSGPEPGGDTFTNSLGMRFVRIPAGTFMMGSPVTDAWSYEGERPYHQVTLSQDFYIMTTEVTQGQWQAVMGSNPSYFNSCGENCPVENVSWNDVQVFIDELNALERKHYRLPTEAEWEYAARAGTTTAFYNGDMTEEFCYLDPNLDAIGWYCGNSGNINYPHPVAQKQSNSWGLYDMSGNIYEWVEDDWHPNYDGAPTDGSAWVESPRDSAKIVRGGGFSYEVEYCRSAYRFFTPQSDRVRYYGFRLVFSP